MKSKTSFFNMGIYKSMLRRFWPLWVLHFAGFALIMPICTLVNSVGPSIDETFVHLITGSMVLASPVIALIMAALSAMAVYSFMYNSRNTGLIASLPVRREAVFCSAWFAAVSAVVISSAVIALTTFLFALPSGADAAPAFASVCKWLAAYSMHFILFFGIASVTAVMTGSNVAMPVLFIIFNFLVAGVEVLVRLYCSELLWGMHQISYAPTLDFLSPIIFFVSDDPVSYLTTDAFDAGMMAYSYGNYYGFEYSHWLASGIYCGVGIVLSLIAMLMYKARRMETAGDVIAVARLKPIFKYGFAFCAALCGGLLIYLIFYDLFSDSNAAKLISMTIGMVLFAFIGYFGSKMLLEKSFHVFRRSWVGYIVTCCLCIALVLCCDLDVFGLCNIVPDPDDVESVSVFDAGNITDRDAIADYTELHKKIVSERSHYENFVSDGSDYLTPISISYYLKDGSVIQRWYDICARDENYMRYYEIMNSPAVLKAAFSCEFPVDDEHCYEGMVTGAYLDDAIFLTSRQAVDFYNNALMADIEAGNKLLYGGGSSPYYGNVTLCLADTADTDYAYEYADITVDITSNCENCLKWLKDNLNLDLKAMYDDNLSDEDSEFLD